MLVISLGSKRAPRLPQFLQAQASVLRHQHAAAQALTASASAPQAQQDSLPSFNDHRLAFYGQSTGQLLRALGIFT